MRKRGAPICSESPKLTLLPSAYGPFGPFSVGLLSECRRSQPLIPLLPQRFQPTFAKTSMLGVEADVQSRTALTHACMFSPSGRHQDQSPHPGVAPEKWASRQNSSLWSSWLWVNALFLRCLLGLLGLGCKVKNIPNFPPHL